MRYRHVLRRAALSPIVAACVWAGQPGPAAAADAEPTLPLWEAGLAGGGGYLSDYPGANQSHARGIVLPMLIYRGPILRVDQDGIRGRLLDTRRWTVELSATAAFSAKDNALRQGMAPLDYLFGVGPQWVYKGLQPPRGELTLRLKLRALMSSDLRRLDARGYSVDPELRWRLPDVAGTPATLTLSLQPTWASAPLQRYFYEVPAANATADRPAYAARAGYLGTEAAMTLSRRPMPGLSWFVSGQLMALHGAANRASPLLRNRSNLSIGAGLIWTPWRSSDAAPG
jgi:outer membrane scaffolding protein for murein synthesis (MipA/OmpV family)